MIDEKIQQAIGILQEKEIDMWLTFVRETHVMEDPILDFILGTGVTWQSAFIITASGETLAIAGNLDIANLEGRGHYQEHISYVQSIRNDLIAVLSRFNPNTIAINYSLNTPSADGLTAGMYLHLMSLLKNTPFADRLVSAESIIAALRGRKTPEELSRMRTAIDSTLEIFGEVTGFIRPGKTEKEIADFVSEKVAQRNLTLAWDREMCPAVFTGPHSAGAHAGPTDRVIEPGHLLNMDFGVKVDGYCADLQRTWYICREHETAAPEHVQHGFRTLRKSIDLVADALKPGVTGKAMDDIVRNYLIENGYEGYPHGLGHQVGRAAHDGGALLGPDWERYGNTPFIPVEASEVYTIEPRLFIPDHGIVTIEEEVLVGESGSEFLSPPQAELWVISG